MSKSIGLRSEERVGLYLENYVCADMYFLELFSLVWCGNLTS